MGEFWELKATSNINQMLRLRNNLDLEKIKDDYKDLLIVKHHFHIADDIMFPDPACLAFFTSFEENYLLKNENAEYKLLAIDIFEGDYKFLIYCKDYEKTLHFCIDYLKSNSLYKCDFEILKNDNLKSFEDLNKDI